MSDIKISNELLSWVLGCECEFRCVIENVVLCKPNHILSVDTDIIMSGCSIIEGTLKINLYTFIHLAKIKALESGYNVTFHNPWDAKIFNQETYEEKFFSTEKLRSFENGFNIETEIEALEWVCKEIGEKNE